MKTVQIQPEKVEDTFAYMTHMQNTVTIQHLNVLRYNLQCQTTHPCLHPLLSPSMISMQVTGTIRANTDYAFTMNSHTNTQPSWPADEQRIHIKCPLAKTGNDEYFTKWRRVWKVQLWDPSHRFSVSLAVNFWIRFLSYSDVPVAVIILVTLPFIFSPQKMYI